MIITWHRNKVTIMLPNTTTMLERNRDTTVRRSRRTIQHLHPSLDRYLHRLPLDCHSNSRPATFRIHLPWQYLHRRETPHLVLAVDCRIAAVSRGRRTTLPQATQPGALAWPPHLLSMRPVQIAYPPIQSQRHVADSLQYAPVQCRIHGRPPNRRNHHRCGSTPATGPRCQGHRSIGPAQRPARAQAPS